jgi:hypothetical protein
MIVCVDERMYMVMLFSVILNNSTLGPPGGQCKKSESHSATAVINDPMVSGVKKASGVSLCATTPPKRSRIEGYMSM